MTRIFVASVSFPYWLCSALDSSTIDFLNHISTHTSCWFLSEIIDFLAPKNYSESTTIQHKDDRKAR